MTDENMQKHLPFAGQFDSSKHVENGTCPRCGYDLRGLLYGQRCPECGRRIMKGASPNVLEDVDTIYLQRIALGMRLVIVAWCLIFPVWPVSVFLRVPRPALAIMLTAGLAAGLVATVLTASRRGAGGGTFGDRRSVLHSVLLVTAAILLLLALYLTSRVLASLTAQVRFDWHAILLLWCCVWQIPFCLLAYRLCDVIRDEPLGRAFWTLAWALAITGPIGGLGAIAVLGRMVPLPCLSILVFTLGLIVTECAFLYFTWRLAGSYTWAVRYHYDVEARNARLREKRRAD